MLLSARVDWPQTKFGSFGPEGTSIDPNSISDVNKIFYGDVEYQALGVEHAKEMLKKRT
jgi:hypothetical protein